ncbi:MAG: hypothetical protein RMX65_019215 [Nostoc sp. DedQUE01]|nr:VWA domain-containing protein [Nostoc sp. DedQUE01]
MVRRPGGELATRPLHFIWLCDTSGSMSIDGKIEALNNAIRQALPQMRQVADENPNANVLVRALKFSHGAEWHIPNPTSLDNFGWSDLIADPLEKPKLDIVFMVDTSGSMSDEINAVKSSCVAFADRIIKEGANVRLGLVGFGIGGHRGGSIATYKVHNLSRYTIGIWSLTSPQDFKKNIQSLSLGLFGGGGCYLANRDTVDIFPYVVRTFDDSSNDKAVSSTLESFMERFKPRNFEDNSQNSRILVIISDEIGNNEGLSDIVSQLKSAAITAHVLGVPKRNGAHESIANMTGGKFWDISKSKGEQDFSTLLGTVAEAIAKEVTRKLANGTVSAGTDMGTGLEMVAQQLKIPPMTDRALPPVLVLISDGQPTDDFASGLKALMAQPWGKKAVRIAIAIGKDAELDVLQDFIGNLEIKPLQANNPDALVKYIKWASTAVLKAASSPATLTTSASASGITVPIAAPPIPESDSAADVW